MEDDSLLPTVSESSPTSPGWSVGRWLLTAAGLATAGSLAFLSTSHDQTPIEPVLAQSSSKKLSNVVVFYTDDQGHNDIGYQSTDMAKITPHLDKLAAGGIKLSQFYGMPLCSPSRSALMTGMYAMRTGMQHSMIAGHHPWGLPLELNIMPQYFKELGYATHMVGKWHLGHFSSDMLPLSRGFDTFYGSHSGYIHHFTHISESSYCDGAQCLKDIWDQHSPIEDADGIYDAEMYQDYVYNLLQEQSADTPFFLYYATSLPHEPMGAPERIYKDYAGRLETVKDPLRRDNAAMLVALDEQVRNLTDTLESTGLMDNTLFIYASDNGAMITGEVAGSNWPLRGTKGTLFEGGVRTPAFIYSPLLPSSVRGTTYSNLFHTSDWLPTIMGGLLDSQALLDSMSVVTSSNGLVTTALDGVNHWDTLIGASDDVPRTTIVHNIDYINDDGSYMGDDSSSPHMAAIRVGDFKLITRSCLAGWYNVGPLSDAEIDELDDIVSLNGAGDYTFLFNIAEDPNETENLADSMPSLVKQLTAELKKYEKSTMSTAMYCNYNDLEGLAEDVQSGGMLYPWVKDVEKYTCPWRFRKTGDMEKDFSPVHLS